MESGVEGPFESDFLVCFLNFVIKNHEESLSVSGAFHATWYYRFRCMQLNISACVISMLNQMKL
jgi:hypothetical protein